MQRLDNQGESSLAHMAMSADEAEVARVMQICNACRYCEGFCAVFPAMTRRLEFNQTDAHYLANLCHSCGACLHACQYAPPHEFAVNVPLAMSKVRKQTYKDFAWPVAFGRLYDRAGLTVAIALAAGLAAFLVLTVLIGGGLNRSGLGANFYAVFPHNFMVAVFGAAFGFAILALTIGVIRFWRTTSPARGLSPEDGTRLLHAATPAAAETVANIATLKYLDGGHGEGCNNEDDRFTKTRRVFHHFTFYGFLLCFAATSVGTLYHYAFGLVAPYPMTSLPVILGSVGGVGLLVGPAGLLWLGMTRHPRHGDESQRAMDRGFIALLFLVSATGFVLLFLRGTSQMPLWLAIHLGTVLALFLTLPYGKFAHGIFRGAALLKYTIEKRLPDRLGLGSE